MDTTLKDVLNFILDIKIVSILVTWLLLVVIGRILRWWFD